MPNNKPPRELVKQVEVIAKAIESLNDLIDSKKIKVENYGKDFLEPLSKIRTKALELRNDLEFFKHNLEMSLTQQYYGGERFATAIKKVTDNFLKSDISF
jgi:hypothetical protein